MMYLIVAVILLFSNLALAAADLELKTVTGLPGSELKVRFAVVNHGPDAADQPACNIYFYANENLILSHAANLLPLAAGAERTEELTFPVPKKPVTTVKVEVFDAQQADVQPSTNFMQVNIKPPDLRAADMQIVDVKADDEEGKGGFLVRLRNNGPARILPSRLKVELEIFGDIIARSEKRVERLDSSAEVETRVQIPNAPVIPSPNGLLYLRWDSAEVQDSEPSNNVYKMPVPLLLRMPDLIPVKATIDKQGVLNFRVQNRGNVKASPSVTALYVNGALVERYDTPAIGPRQTSEYQYKAMKLTAEDKIVIVTDFNADVQESSEENNRLNEPS
jgi:hypothetical protein